MKVGVIIAMDIEYRQMRDALGGDSGRLGNNDIVLWQCGIGKVNAAVGTMRLVQEHRPDAIVSTGLAGGIDRQMQVMDVLAATQAVYHDVDCGTGLGCQRGQVQGLPPRFDADAHLIDTALATARDFDGRLMTGLICTGDQFITDREALNGIKRHFIDGLACDMESAAIAQTCYLFGQDGRTQGYPPSGVPFLSLRVISDTPGRTDNHQQQWEDFLASMCDTSFHFVKQFLEKL
ncbi:MAG: 5'-methylthioadenosine/S-adenosylhomocysteine nucleosidase [Bacteroidales bacterium]|nr:5'-methylthioadenosine/S-adenosylhomocysteine nucleosidase [Bacteroidales bacterium]